MSKIDYRNDDGRCWAGTPRAYQNCVRFKHSPWSDDPGDCINWKIPTDDGFGCCDREEQKEQEQ